jgi:hypothetical protein
MSLVALIVPWLKKKLLVKELKLQKKNEWGIIEQIVELEDKLD